MNRERALQLLRGGPAGVARWNRWRLRHQDPADAPDLSDADLRSVDLTDADLRGVVLTRANIGRAKLFGATLDLCDLREACLDEADLNAASLRAADLSGASLRRARLYGADFRDATLSKTTLQLAEYDDRTKWSSAAIPEALGATGWPRD